MIDPAAVPADQPLGPGQYRYVTTHAWWMASFGSEAHRFSYLGENIIQVWVPADQSHEWLLDRRVTGRRVWLAGSPQEAAAAGREIHEWPAGRWRAPYGDFFLAAGEQAGPREGWWQIPTPGFLACLPRDPVQLYKRLQADSPDGWPGDNGAFVYAVDALRGGLVPADLRSALYRALLLIPGVTVAEAGEAQTGQAQTISLSLDDGTRRTEIFISGADGQFTGERSTLTRDNDWLKAGTVTESTRVTVATVDAIGLVPAMPGGPAGEF